jgi:uncharacterized delta-60 repeat protein
MKTHLKKLARATALLSITIPTLVTAAPVTLVPYSQNWSYLHPMGSLPSGSGANEPNSGTTKWYAPEIEFMGAYTGPAFGSIPSRIGTLATTTSYDSGSGAGPIGYDAGLDYLTAANVPLPRPFSSLGTTLTQPLSSNRRTAYFRTNFVVPAEGVENLVLNYLIDDGAFVYLDGELIARINIGTLGSTASVADTYTTLAANETATENQLRSLRLDLTPGSSGGIGTATSSPAVANATCLKPVPKLGAGTHTLAVSVHNQAATNADLSMAVSVTGETIETGSLDPIVNHNFDANFGGVYTLASQADGKTLIGGAFTAMGSQASSSIGRLNADGTIDSSWLGSGVTGVSGPQVYAIAVQDDGKILVGGSFNAANGEPRNGIARLNADGTTDFTFDPGTGASSGIRSIALMPDGKILVAGSFSTFNGQSVVGVVRLAADGSIDPTFQPPPSLFPGLYFGLAYGDGRSLVGGNTSANYTGGTIQSLVRISAAGSLDSNYNQGAGGSFDHLCAILQPDGRALLGGVLSWNNIARRGIIRLSTSGTLESTATFNVGTGTTGFLESILSLALQADGKILGVGDFTVFSELAQYGLIRVNANGSADTTMNAALNLNASTDARSVLLAADGSIWLGGFFGSIRGQTRDILARIRNSGGSESVSVANSTTVRWLRTGALPEFVWARLDLSTDQGVTWNSLGGLANHITGGWEFSGLALPPSGMLRCRGRVPSSGSLGTGSGLVEKVQRYGAGTALEAWRQQNFGISVASKLRRYRYCRPRQRRREQLGGVRSWNEPNRVRPLPANYCPPRE